MNLQLLESLLYQEESEALDFKVQQYPFSGATDEEKGELLKDILAFANAWRQTDAYILVGVQEVRGGRSIVCGIDAEDHLLNRNLQQFVHSKTNRPVAFWYAPVKFEGVDVGVLTIPLQDRPVYLTKPYGKLAPEVVYIRRRDTTSTASPEEIARMGSTAVLREVQPTLEVEFANLPARRMLGTTIVVESRVVEIPDRQSIPLYGPPPKTIYGVSLDVMDGFRNRDYYRDFATYIRERALLCPVGVTVTNASPTVAEEVWVTLELDATTDLVVLDEGGVPSEPSTNTMPTIRPASFQRRQRVRVGRYGDRYEVRIQIGTVQPGTTQWSDESFYVGARCPVTAIARVQMSANNLRTPITLEAEIAIEVKRVRVSVEDVTNPGQSAQPK
ncbi:MAG: ATP-binding protein [Bryobacteraceae bacterium]